MASVGFRDYVNQQGVMGQLAEWRSTCLVCGTAFEITTPAKASSVEDSKSFLVTTARRTD